MIIRARFFLVFLLLFNFATSLVSQKLHYRQGELIVQLKEEIDGKDWAKKQRELSHFRKLMRGQNIWLLEFDFARYGEAEMRNRINKDQRVVNVQYNRLVDYRSSNVPNDPLYPNQWQYDNTGQIGGQEGADINACPAWDVSTGGLTANGDTIVVCVIDNGVDEDHEDLIPNIWINRDEIPGNGLDDDNNGFIDDYRGWNTANNNNNINGGTHGTSVAGIVGAKGNNSIGVTGVSWDVKVMIVRNNFASSESEILEAYGYALDARRDYDNSGGTAGAYVVATNASWGVNNGDPDDSPIWCAFYDTLGSYGILNAGATTNTNTNVDELGDLPTTCPSNYLIGVTNVNTNDEKVTNAGYGSTSIDLGAHGESVYTTRNDNSYGAFGGTSAATPMVAGAIGLLYSAPSPLFGELLQADPAAAALFIRGAILNNTRSIPSLNNITVTGGVLDLGSAMSAVVNIGNNCLPPTSIDIAAVGATALRLNWNAISSVDAVSLRYRFVGSSSWTTLENVNSPYELTNLEQCRLYELQLLARCGNEVVASPVFQEETDGCCRRPDDFTLSVFNNQGFRVTFSDVLAARNYRIRYRPTGSGNWDEQLAISSPIVVTGLSNCTEYEVEISSNCDTTDTGFGNRMRIQTSGCGACLDADYCVPTTVNNDSEFIDSINFANLYQNRSGAEMNGYRNFGEEISLEVARAGVYPISLKPGFDGNAFRETFQIWIDFDQNGFFSSNEEVGDTTSNGGDIATINIAIPENVPLGSTRMRIVMRFNILGNAACSVSNFFGEVEDYCLNIVESAGCVAPSQIEAVYDESSEQVTISWLASGAPDGTYLLRYRPTSGGAWTELITQSLSVTLDQIPVCENYDVEVYSNCGMSNQSAAQTTLFNSCSSTRNLTVSAEEWTVSPNPTNGPTRIHWQSQEQLSLVSVYNLQGRLYYRSSNVDFANRMLDLATLPAGVYLIEIVTANNRRGLKRLIVE